MRLEKLLHEKVAADRDLQERQQTFTEPENWPSNSPDLNPVDYSVWGTLQQMLYCHTISDIDQLKRVVIDCLAQLNQDTEPSDRSAVKKTDDGYQGKGCAC